MIVETIAAKKRLPPDARPRAATDQMLAAVDIPRTDPRCDIYPSKPCGCYRPHSSSIIGAVTDLLRPAMVGK